MTFTGIPLAALDFYEDLEVDNSKTFWTAHQQVYEEQVKGPLMALADALEPEFGSAKYFRPHRDVRFSKDKTPYKVQQGLWFGESSRYVHVSAAGLFVAGGYWRTSAEQVARLRRAIADDIAGSALERAVADLRRSRLEVSGERLTRVPSGYDKEHPRAELLRYKTLTTGREFGAPAWLATKKTQSEIVRSWRAMTPLVTWLQDNVGHDAG
jgi:uncharacterized protein (TIGR02453 family)